MTEAQEHNEEIFAKFKKQQQAHDHKIFCILSINKNGLIRIIQSAMYTPKQIAERLFKIANQIIHNLNNPPN